ncbi:MAG: hypothetical protein QM608_11740 [Caulobacter sp.]
MTNRKWRLLSGDRVLGELSLRTIDQPFLFCDFTPHKAYAPLAGLFATEAAALEAGDDPAWEAAEAELFALDLVLVESNGERIVNPLIHINGKEAWFRY